METAGAPRYAPCPRLTTATVGERGRWTSCNHNQSARLLIRRESAASSISRQPRFRQSGPTVIGK